MKHITRRGTKSGPFATAITAESHYLKFARYFAGLCYHHVFQVIPSCNYCKRRRLSRVLAQVNKLRPRSDDARFPSPRHLVPPILPLNDQAAWSHLKDDWLCQPSTSINFDWRDRIERVKDTATLRWFSATWGKESERRGLMQTCCVFNPSDLPYPPNFIARRKYGLNPTALYNRDGRRRMLIVVRM